MDDRVSFDKKGESFRLIIKALKDEKKQKMLLFWIALASLGGIIIFSQFFFDYENSTKLFIGVYLAFLFYFLFKVIYAYRWRNNGQEVIIINDGKFTFIKEIGKRGVTQIYEVDKIEKLRFFNDENTNKFMKEMSTSYWNINKYTLVFDYDGIMVPFGLELEYNQAKRVMKEITANMKP